MKKTAYIYYRKDIRSNHLKLIGLVNHKPDSGTVEIDIKTSSTEWLKFDPELTIDMVELWTRYLVYEFSYNNIFAKFGNVFKEENMLDEMCKYHTGNICMKVVPAQPLTNQLK